MFRYTREKSKMCFKPQGISLSKPDNPRISLPRLSRLKINIAFKGQRKKEEGMGGLRLNRGCTARYPPSVPYLKCTKGVHFYGHAYVQ